MVLLSGFDQITEWRAFSTPYSAIKQLMELSNNGIQSRDSALYEYFIIHADRT